MDEESFRRKLGEILGVMDAHAADASDPKSAKDERSEPAPGWPDHLRDSVARLHVAVDQLRLRVKYLVFDLEATRRERTRSSVRCSSDPRATPAARSETTRIIEIGRFAGSGTGYAFGLPSPLGDGRSRARSSTTWKTCQCFGSPRGPRPARSISSMRTARQAGRSFGPSRRWIYSGSCEVELPTAAASIIGSRAPNSCPAKQPPGSTVFVTTFQSRSNDAARQNGSANPAWAIA